MSEEKPTGNTAEPQKIEHTFLYTLCRILFGFAFHTFCPVRYHFTERIDAMNAELGLWIPLYCHDPI